MSSWAKDAKTENAQEKHPQDAQNNLKNVDWWNHSPLKGALARELLKYEPNSGAVTQTQSAVRRQLNEAWIESIRLVRKLTWWLRHKSKFL
jgi:hypothetical protein